ncbi:hypothetical protein [Aeromonas veronii]|uniref:hypothetical protein n=1 Tax=Aeromonas veronii TaxID=654 RepID=UPI002B4AAC4C|nr:hypothetical protein [Aeromonas veronii]
MHRIDTPSRQKDKFGSGKDGFTRGDPQTGTPATEVSADILDTMQEEICAVVEEAGISLDKENNSQLLSAIKKLASSRYFSAGQPLPLSNIGPIWHDDYHDWMTWQTFNQNGANYTGYASRLIGSLLLDTQPTPRSGYIKSGVQNLSRVTYAALRAWAMHNGIMVAPGVWTAGTIQCADNADGTTFRIYDVRGEFLRAWDDSRGVDSGRTAGSWQGDAMRNLTGYISGISESFSGSGAASGVFSKSSSGPTVQGTPGTTDSGLGGTVKLDLAGIVPTADENRTRNAALVATIKF